MNILCIGETLGIDLTDAHWEKIEKIKSNYPVEKIKGHSKYEIRKKLNAKSYFRQYTPSYYFHSRRLMEPDHSQVYKLIF